MCLLEKLILNNFRDWLAHAFFPKDRGLQEKKMLILNSRDIVIESPTWEMKEKPWHCEQT